MTATRTAVKEDGFMVIDRLTASLQSLGTPEFGNEKAQAGAVGPALLCPVIPEDWGDAAEAAAAQGCRWAGGWGEARGESWVVNALLEKSGDYLLLRTVLPPGRTGLPSHTPHFPGAARPERHTRDLLGLKFIGHPDDRRWVRHQAWGEREFPLRPDFPLAGQPPAVTAPDRSYGFASAHGPEVNEIPVGPVHAGIIEPGHFRFLALGETVLNLEERLGYVHKGIEKLAVGRDPEGLARLAGRVSGDTTVGHAWAACQAMEHAAGVAPPERALWLRAIFLERERVANHLNDIGAICNDTAFAFGHSQFSRLRELWLRDNLRWFGHRLLMDRIVPGGVAVDLPAEATSAMPAAMAALRSELEELKPILDESTIFQDRVVGAGVLSERIVRELGCLGYVARACGIGRDVRERAPHAPYDRLGVKAVTRGDGDVAARLYVRYEELFASLDILDQCLRRIEPGPLRADWRTPPANAEGLGLVEGWRGEIATYVRFDGSGSIVRFFPRDPSVFNWPALEKLILGNIVPDFPLCNKSVNGSYSGHDL
ncbi:hydrogenase large subunit [Methylococcus capsulatus]|uniref:hydrogenase large subunit n=1 Tax=Methylococcus capsulatus TaxID=414 RepID=UPI001C52C346|nr:NADH-quinone oxidoreductase subunit C [Methylococcus capsulatus]QXP88133.1 NADH-quinone oxidoreductase subunit C [Methylococcus capsulatus]QXP94859.1 NADH-quinone oxidoreductase subunit C [Methylococcus capsulatus]